MNEITVNFVMQNGSNVEVAVPENIVIEDALQQLVDAGEATLPGPKQYWIVSNKETGESLDISRTMADNNVKDHTSLNVTIGGVA